MRERPKDLEASILARLRNYTRENLLVHQDVLTYYGLERFLYRLSQSKWNSDFVLKGALAMLAWNPPTRRSTLDIDLRGFLPADIGEIIEVIKQVCQLDVEPDGVRFDPDSIEAEHIVEGAEYSGIRVRLVGYIARTRLYIQLDIAFTGPLIPQPDVSTFPTILDLPPPHIRTYRPEQVIAEKLEAIAQLGTINSRIKDFYDIWVIQSTQSLDSNALIQSINAIFAARGTEIPRSVIAAIDEDYIEGTESSWQIFLKRIGEDQKSISFAQVIADIDTFLAPVFASLHTQKQ
jgi:predicted nucleotidyltransferase component of viral defense system